ncbi:toll/interleukin-1 receptor (TIR) domain-containing protein [Artemisia annua]|uniref:Toll/interleukin-1 receptor (TIR) domain-containing protein n=1 Tax=Artemisia annua TaxID=35608 RepID=A0A2U1NIU6_ARTAN|nr:toll/interleukin-1 receptor (TIR) domain-containing protein [Artemisia annua]
MASSSSRSWKYDVFLSFRGEDTRKNFVDHFYTALGQRLIRTYKDDITPRPFIWERRNITTLQIHEAAVIQNIVDAISDKLLSSNSDIDEELVGMTDRVKDLISRLEIGTGAVRMVGIWGVGGGGKTTLATSVYMKISDHFQGHCIVENIREESSKSGLKKLHENILKEVLKREVRVQSVEQGKRMIQSRLCHSKVLILLGDVDDPKQLDALAGSHSWFGDGSRIIITTKDEHVLKTRNVDHISPVTLLSQDEGIRLFIKHAYNEEEPLKDYGILSLRVVSYAHGLPLALKVLESEIMEKLKISYDGLKKVEKELFLDIACLFRWRSKDNAMEIFIACGFHPDIGIKVLIQKALITINLDGLFNMHDLVQEMAHYVVRGEHPDNPEKHSRVWKKEEIRNMCLGDGTTYFKFVSNLKKLRWIHVSWIHVIMSNDDNLEGPYFLSNELRYINWDKYPASPFPDSFQPMNLAVLKMSCSFQKELWRSHKRLPKLKILQLHDMRKLVSTPNFDGLPCLQNLELRYCKNLEEIHPSIGNHRSLKIVKGLHRVYIQQSSCMPLRFLEHQELVNLHKPCWLIGCFRVSKSGIRPSDVLVLGTKQEPNRIQVFRQQNPLSAESTSSRFILTAESILAAESDQQKQIHTSITTIESGDSVTKWVYTPYLQTHYQV